MSESDETTVSRRFLLTAAVSAIGVIALYLLAVRTTVGQRFDDIAFAGRAVEDPELTRLTNEVLHSVTRFSLAVLTAALVVLALLRRRIRLAIAVGAAVTASVVTTEVLKLHVLDRPLLDDVEGIEINSYPSGHATIAMALALGLVLVTPHRSRWLAAGVAVAGSMLFGIGVLATGWHRPSDTLGAYLVCLSVFSLVVGLMSRAGWIADVASDGVESWMHGRALVVAVVGLVAVAGFALFESLQADSLRTVEYAADYLAVCLVILVCAAVTVVGFTGALRGMSIGARPGADASA